jgi:hypothetical protein
VVVIFADARELRVELDVFSGRPNPRWTLSGPSLADVIRHLPEGARAEAAEPAHLGYRGFVLRANGERAVVFGGLIHLRSAEGREVRRDEAGLEEQLLGQAHELGYGDVIDAMRI